MLYAVCTNCSFLRAFSREARDVTPPERCPNCHSEVVTYTKTGRFQPTYIGRVSLDLHAVPPIARGTGNPSVPPV